MNEGAQKSSKPWMGLEGISVGLPTAKRVLVLAPHPDDECLGCGGTLLLYGEQGVEVRVAVLTLGEALQPGDTALPNQRKQEAYEAAAILGIRHPELLGFPDGALAQCKSEVRAAIGRILSEYKPDLLFAPSPIDAHPDHVAVSDVAIELLQEYPWLRLAFYEVYTPIRFNALVEISRVLPRKEEALKRYQHSLLNKPDLYTQAIKGLHGYRNFLVGHAEGGYFEAFWIVTGPLDIHRIAEWLLWGRQVEHVDPAAALLSEIKTVDRMISEVRKLEERVQSGNDAKEQEVQRLHDLLLEAKRAAGKLAGELHLITTSRGWKFLRSLHVLRDVIFPPKTKRRKLYHYVIKGVSLVKREGSGDLEVGYKTAQALPTRTVPAPQEVIMPEKGMEPFIIPMPERVKVSIIMPVYNQSNYSYKCLRSIAGKVHLGYEVIVVNNASTDDTEQVLSLIGNILVISNQENLGFIEACNQGANYAKGDYLLFLHNDTQLDSGAVEHLVETMAWSKQIGIVGARLLYPDGRLQEAGAIVWNDGSAMSYGESDNPELPAYSYVRDVDYCSSACLLVRSDVFERLGGFDRRYTPAYYEDTDLCFAARRLGYRVVYQPLAKAIHYRGVTSGRETSSVFMKYQVINQKKFVQKWDDELSAHYPASHANVVLARSRRHGKRILIVDQHVPTFDKDSGSLRMYWLLKILSGLGHIVSFWPDNLVRDEPYTDQLQQMGVEVLYGPLDFMKYLAENPDQYDLIMLSRSDVAIQYMAMVKEFARNASVLFDTVDLQYLREYRRAALEGNAELIKQAEVSREQELYLMYQSDITVTVSDVEKQILLREHPHLTIEVVPNIHEIKDTGASFFDREGLLFVGGFLHLPNEDAVLYFVKEIFPSLLKTHQTMKLYVVGTEPPRSIRDLESDHIIITGYVKDLTPYFEKTRVCVAPLRYGAGIKGKIGQSMGYGLPVVTTSIGAEGMGLVDGKNALIADEPEDFAEKVLRLYNDETLWHRIRCAALQHIETYYSPAVVEEKLRKLIEKVSRSNSRTP
jgi:GT2 family glycosyltransferase/LmbE family N-acetylglucosaminyl deacetylase